jgi:RND family efflux transporter MFP subunit
LASGKVQSVNVEVGDVVSAGQNLFTIDSTQAELQYQQAVLNVKNLEDAIDTIERNLTRTRSLYEAGAAAKTDVEQLETSYDSTQIQLNQAKISVDQAAESLSYYNVTAPSGGYVTAVNVVAGGLAGQSAAAVVITDTSVLELNAGLSEYLISSVHVGDTVNVSIESASDELFEGTITQISEAPTQGTYTYPVTIKVNDPNGLIKAGMFAEVRLISARKENVVAVPSDAVITSSGEKKVVVLNSDGETVSLKSVSVGVDNGTTAEITSGLSTGETIVVKGQTYVKEGEQVHVVK